MSKKDPLIHFPMYCNQYMGKLAKYTYEQQGAFIRVLCGYIAEDGSISCSKPESKYRLFSAFTQSEQEALNTVYSDAVSLAKEIMNTQKIKRQRRRDNGKKGGRPKDGLPNNQKDNQLDNQLDNQKGTERVSNTETETETEKEKEKDQKPHHGVSTKTDVNLEENFCQLCKEPFVDGACPTCGWGGEF